MKRALASYGEVIGLTAEELAAPPLTIDDLSEDAAVRKRVGKIISEAVVLPPKRRLAVIPR
jgi:hypothetical protein